MNAKRQKLEELDANERRRVGRSTGMVFALTALVCLIMVGCFACSHDDGPGELTPEMMTTEQQTLYWTAKVNDVWWTPEVDPSQGGKGDGKLHFGFDFPEPMRIHTHVNALTNAVTLNFFLGGEEVESFELHLTGCEGSFLYDASKEPWRFRLSDKNGTMCLTVTDSESKTVYFDQIPGAIC